MPAPFLRLVKPSDAPAKRPPRRQRSRHAPSLRTPGYTACGLPPSTRPADNLDLVPPWTCRRCLAIRGEEVP